MNKTENVLLGSSVSLKDVTGVAKVIVKRPKTITRNKTHKQIKLLLMVNEWQKWSGEV